MMEEVFENIFKIDIPLTGNPMESVNSYVIKGHDSNLIIDTGLSRKSCTEIMYSALKQLKINLLETDFCITHIHADHSGLVAVLATTNSRIYISQLDGKTFSDGTKWDDIIDYAIINGFPEGKINLALSKHLGFKYGSERYNIPITILGDQENICIGEYNFKCIETPGHSKGHICLYEPNNKILLSGDHIIGDITPTIQSWSDGLNPLHKYLLSLDKIYALDVEIVLPGHRCILTNCKERIRELKCHHQKRCSEILSILESGGRNAYQIASHMSWNVGYGSWDPFPDSQKWFATGEAIAHLQYLEGKQIIICERLDGKIIYSLK